MSMKQRFSPVFRAMDHRFRPQTGPGRGGACPGRPADPAGCPRRGRQSMGGARVTGLARPRSTSCWNSASKTVGWGPGKGEGGDGLVLPDGPPPGREGSAARSPPGPSPGSGVGRRAGGRGGPPPPGRDGRPAPVQGAGTGDSGEGLEFPEGGQAAVGLPEDLLQGQDPLLEGLALGSQQGLVGRRALLVHGLAQLGQGDAHGPGVENALDAVQMVRGVVAVAGRGGRSPG